MEEKRRIQKGFKKINDRIIYVYESVDGSMGVIIFANSRKAQQMGVVSLVTMGVAEIPADRELIQLWPHRTRRKNEFSLFYTEDYLKNEIEKRGFVLTNGKWVKKL